MSKKVLSKIDIYPKIISELKKSEKEILVVSDWFINDKLFGILLHKQKQGVQVKLIVDDNLADKRIKVSDLTKCGGEIYKIEKENFGLMHKNYCIVDDKTAIFPLVISSSFILVNNLESLIITGHNKTIHNLKNHFYKLMDGAAVIGKGRIKSLVLSWIKNRVPCIFKIKKSKVRPVKNDFESEMIPNQEIGFKMKDVSDILKNESNYFYKHRN